jgi:glycosyltransferase involved in cell wall biosynthesis
VALESFKYGVPVVAARIGGLKEIICDGQNGLLFDANNPHALADALLQLGAENQALRAQQFREAALTSLQLYKPELIAARIESAILLAIADLQTAKHGAKLLKPAL